LNVNGGNTWAPAADTLSESELTAVNERSGCDEKDERNTSY
jgi:hypothetical protein